MTLVLQTPRIMTGRRVPGPVMPGPRNDAGPRGVSDGYRDRSIDSLQVLALAVVGSVATPALLRLAL